MMVVFGLILVGAFLFQGALGLIQLRNFSKNYRELRLLGAKQILIGKNPKKFFSGSLLLLAIDSDGNIAEARLMQGVTVFAKFKPVASLTNTNIGAVAASHAELSRYNRLTQQCILNAYETLIKFKTNKLNDSAYDTSVNVFNLPLLTQLKSMYLTTKVKFLKNITK